MEAKKSGALVGPLFQKAIADQFWRLREGDRFHYQNIDVSCEVKNQYPRIKDVLAVSMLKSCTYPSHYCVFLFQHIHRNSIGVAWD